MDRLPEECVEKLMSYVGPLQTCRLAVLSKSLWSASQSEQLWESFLPEDWESVISQTTSLNILQISDRRQLVRRLCKRPLLIDEGKKSWMVDKRTGKITIMLGRKDLRMSGGWDLKSDQDCWFGPSVQMLKLGLSFTICGEIHTGMLSPSTLYAAYLVFKLEKGKPGSNPQSIQLKARLVNHGGGGSGKEARDERELKLGRNWCRRWEHSGVGLALFWGMYRNPTKKSETEWWEEMRGKWWLEAKLGEFHSHAREEDGEDGDELVDISVISSVLHTDVKVYGIELRPSY